MVIMDVYMPMGIYGLITTKSIQLACTVLNKQFIQMQHTK